MIFKGDDIFSEKNLQLINESESRIFDYANTISSFCFINMQNICEKPNSILRLFDGTYGTVDPAFNSTNRQARSCVCVGSSYRTSGKDLKSTGNTLYPIKIRSTVTRIIHMWKTRVKTANTKLDVIVNDTHDGCHMWNRNSYNTMV
jgi:hypothetical protein